MSEQDLWKKIKEIEIKTSKVVSELFSGEYKSAFKGNGLDFKEFKEYEEGDDPRYIDWKVSAKRGTIHVKKFSEERELTLLIALDISNSTFFGSNEQLKKELATEFCASIAFSGMKNNDKVGLILFNDRIVDFITPKKGRNHIIKILKEIITHTYKENKSYKTDISVPLNFINKLFKRRVIIFLVSDFWSEKYENEIKLSAYKHDLINVVISDKREINLSDVGLIEIEDNETGQRYLIDTGDKSVMKSLKNKINLNILNRENIFKKNKMDRIYLNTNESYIIPLNNFFRLREKRF